MSTTVPATPAPATGPPDGKAVAARNATTHGLFARDIVLPALGEDPQGYKALEAAWLEQLPPRTLLEQHYVEKIAAASWRLRRLHRWQAQIFEDETLTEDARLDRLDKVLRHETHLHRQIDTAVKMLAKDAPALYARRMRDEVLMEMMTSERECRESPREDTDIDLETRGRLRRIRKATETAVAALSQAPLDTHQETGAGEKCGNEPAPQTARDEETGGEEAGGEEADGEEATEAEMTEAEWEAANGQKRQNEPCPCTNGSRQSFLASFARAIVPSPALFHTLP